ncbi:TetR/AcrR family transcriptional regulator [Halosegnis marinus]|uniref:TetR/AcrR family transcriptional regulator n=1 Tax=Halosegnis marinus TaxID=3034023 RepID=A0ABD5ZMH1_9EURY|nr:TetR/AcrR family transcriptional regulator [Halosegnis sp. DT85]
MHAGDRSETEEEVMEATYAALAEHGYAGLTVQTIADAFPKSKSLLYYHYDDKEAILRDFIDYLVDAFRAAFEFEGADDPPAALERMLDGLLPREMDDEFRDFRVAVMELLAQAPHEPAYAERFADLYAAIHDGFAGVIAAGVERGDFADVDPEETATMLVAAASGGLTWGVTIRPSLVAGVREVVDGYLAAELYL